MFKLTMVREVDWPVTVTIPQDGGTVTKASMHARFRMLTQAELDEIAERRGDTLAEVLVGWKGVADEDGNDMAFAPESKAKLLEISYVRSALWAAYLEAQAGRAAARKN